MKKYKLLDRLIKFYGFKNAWNIIYKNNIVIYPKKVFEIYKNEFNIIFKKLNIENFNFNRKIKIFKKYCLNQLENCPICNKISIYEKYCSMECYNKSKFGRSKPKNFSEKVKKTKLERYGNSNYNNIEKCKQTKLEKYGDPNYCNPEKIKESCNYSEIYEKVKKTKLEKYGDPNYCNPEKIKESLKSVDYNLRKQKTILTSLEKYGESHFSKTKDYKNKILENFYFWTNMSHLENLEFLESNFIKDKFIENSNFKIKKFMNFFNCSYTTALRYKKKFDIYEPNYDRLEYEFLNIIEFKYNIKLERHFRIYIDESKYYIVDGFDSSSNTIYEFLGDFWHGRSQSTEINPISKRSFKELYNETFDRFSDLSKLGYKIKYIWESDYLNSGLELLKYYLIN